MEIGTVDWLGASHKWPARLRSNWPQTLTKDTTRWLCHTRDCQIAVYGKQDGCV